MSITVATINNRLSTYLRIHLPAQTLKALTNDDYIQYYNDVARDLNNVADIRQERFYKECNTTNAEDSDLTNYLVQGSILKILSFLFIDDAWESQYFTFEDDRIVLKVSPEENTQMDIMYLRDIEDVSDPTDDIDLPDNIIPDFEQLLKQKLLIDYAGSDLVYENLLNQFALKSQVKMNKYYREGVKAYWFGQGDDLKYDITDHWIGLENFTADVNGIYTHVGGND